LSAGLWGWNEARPVLEGDRAGWANGVGVDTAAIHCVAAGDNPQRVRSEAAWAHLCGVAPLQATSGKITRRHRLNRGENRQANHALWRIVFTRLGSDARTRSYVTHRLDEGLNRHEIIRSLNRYIARETHRHLPRRRSAAAGLAQ
jgi:transposase